MKPGRLHTLLAVQERIGLERNQAWLGRHVEVLVDSLTPPRSHDHDDAHNDAPDEAPPVGHVRLSGRTRGNKLVHLEGPAELVGLLVPVRIDHAGPYALRGEVIGAPH